jgi:hypothetical protein
MGMGEGVDVERSWVNFLSTLGFFSRLQRTSVSSAFAGANIRFQI